MRTTPESIDLQRTFREMLDAGDRSAVMEATSHGSVLGRLDRVRFKALAFTNLTQDHLDFHGSMDEYYEAKRRLFTEHEPAPAAAINVGDEWGGGWRRSSALLTVRRYSPSGSPATPRSSRRQARLQGRFNQENTLAALAVARLVGVPRRRSIRVWPMRRASRADSSRSTRVSVLGDRRLRAHARLARERPSDRT